MCNNKYKRRREKRKDKRRLFAVPSARAITIRNIRITHHTQFHNSTIIIKSECVNTTIFIRYWKFKIGLVTVRGSVGRWYFYRNRILLQHKHNNWKVFYIYFYRTRNKNKRIKSKLNSTTSFALQTINKHLHFTHISIKDEYPLNSFKQYERVGVSLHHSLLRTHTNYIYIEWTIPRWRRPTQEAKLN